MFSSTTFNLAKQTSRTTAFTSSLRQFNNSRSFHATTANMVKKVYFDCTWTGPEAQCDANGKITSMDKTEKGTSSPSIIGATH